jgi:anaerobic selenocysteine-containing dehydrogenase
MGVKQLGECERALASLEEALEHMPRSVDATVEQGIALFELCRFAEAQVAFERVLKDAPDEAWAHHYLGLMAERLGDRKEAKERFGKAQALITWNINIAASNPRQADLRETLNSDDLFHVAIDLFPTDTVDHADIILPAASFLEFDDLVTSYFDLTVSPHAAAKAPMGW